MVTERTVLVRLDANPRGFITGMAEAKAAASSLRKEIDTTNDRTAWLAQSFLALAPTVGPLASAAVPALAGIATQMTIAGLAAGTATLAFNGVGDALKALNDYQIDPTDAHLKKLHETMAIIGPTGRDLVRVLDKIRDGFIGVSNLARDKMFPGVIDGLHELSELAPQVEQIIAKTAGTLGSLASEAGQALAGPRFAEFFDFLEAEAVPTLDAMARTIGNVFDGLSAMLVAFKPLSDDFTQGMLNMSRSFADWAHGLRDSESFQNFIDYVREQTPKVLDLLGTLAGTFVDIVQAAAPVGEVMIPVLEDFLKIIQVLVDSPLGPIFIAAGAAMGLYGRAVALASITTGGLGTKLVETVLGFKKVEVGAHRAEVATKRFGDASLIAGGKAQVAAVGYGKAFGRAALGVGALTLALSPLPEKIGLTKTANGALIGSFLGPFGAAVGGAIGLVADLSTQYFEAATNTREFAADSKGLAATLDQETGAVTANTEEYVRNQFVKQGVADAAKDVGISLDDLVDAYLGNELAAYRAQQAIDSYKGSAEDSAEENDKHRQSLELLDSTLGDATGALDKARDGMILTGGEVDTTRRKFKKATEEVNEFGDAVDALDEKLDNRASFNSYQDAIDKLSKAIREDKKPGFTLDPFTAKGRGHRELLDDLAASIKDYAENLPLDKQEAFLDKAEKGFDHLVGTMGKTKGEVKRLKESLGLLDLFEAKPGVRVVGAGKAKDEIDHLGQIMDHLDGKVVNPKVIVTTFFHARDTGPNFGTGPGFAAGGFTGHGGKYEPAGIVHKGEFVVPAPFAQRDRAMLEQMYLPGYAQGGYVQAASAPVTVSGPDFDYERLVDGLLSARQQYGDVYVSGDPTMWRKQMEDDHRAFATGKLGG